MATSTKETTLTNNYKEKKLIKERRDKKYINKQKLKQTGTEEIKTKGTNKNKMITSTK